MARVRDAVVGFFVCLTWSAVAPAQPNPLTLAEGTSEVRFANLGRARTTVYVTVLNTSQSPVTHVRVFATGLRVAEKRNDPSAAIEIPKLDGGARQSIRVDLRLPVTGDHTSHVWLMADKVAAKSVPVHFVRVEAPKTPVAFGELGGIAVHLPFFGKARKSFPITLQETGGVPLRNLHFWIRMAHKVNDKISIDAPSPRLHVAASLEPEQWLELQGEIAGLDRAGQYDATIYVRAPSSAPAASKPFPVYVRESGTLAAVLIFAGVLVSLLLRFLTRYVRPRLAMQQRVAVLFDEIRKAARKASGNPAVEQHVIRIENGLRQQFDQLGLTGRLIGTSAFDIYETKLPLLRAWVDAALELSDARLPAPAIAVARKGLDDAVAVLEDDAAAAEQVNAQVTAMATLRARVDAAAADELAARLDALRKAVAGNAAFAELLTKIAAVARLAARDVRAALQELDALRIEYVRASAKSLHDALAQRAVGLNAGVKANVDAFLSQAAAATDAETALPLLHEAIRAYVTPLAAALEQAIAAKLEDDPVNPANAQLAEVRAELASLQNDITGGKVDGAVQRMLTLQRAYNDALSGTRQGTEIAGTTAAGDAGSGLDVLAALLPSPRSDVVAAAGAVGRNARKQFAIALLTTAIIAILAVILGVKILWSDDWTWGGWQSYLVAFLWGAGLHQLSFDGIAGLMDRW